MSITRKSNTKKDNTHPVDENTAKAKKLFLTHSCNVFYFTADGEAFTELTHAKNHAVSLKNKQITTINREEI